MRFRPAIRRAALRGLCGAVAVGLVLAASPLATLARDRLLKEQEPGFCSALLDLPATAQNFGGLSGLELSSDGTRFDALSDRGRLVHGRMMRAADGTLKAVVFDWSAWPGGAEARAGKLDSEGLAIAPDGGMYLSTENAGIFFVNPHGFTLRLLPTVPDQAKLAVNRKYEALAAGADGTLYTIPEKPAAFERRGDPLWQLRDGQWRIIRRLKLEDGFRPVGADVGPDGALYLLERSWQITFRNRVLRIDLKDASVPPQVVWQTDAYPLHNFEGLAAWKGPRGIMLTLISDNNFMSVLGQSLCDISLAPKARGR